MHAWEHVCSQGEGETSVHKSRFATTISRGTSSPISGGFACVWQKAVCLTRLSMAIHMPVEALTHCSPPPPGGGGSSLPYCHAPQYPLPFAHRVLMTLSVLLVLLGSPWIHGSTHCSLNRLSALTDCHLRYTCHSKPQLSAAPPPMALAFPDVMPPTHTTMCAPCIHDTESSAGPVRIAVSPWVDSWSMHDSM